METKAKYLSIKEASVYTAIPVATLRLFRAQGRGPESFLMEGRVKYEVERLDQWIEEQKAGTARGASS